MTASAPPVYPSYCFHLSPTVNKYCHLQIKDIIALRTVPGFEGQNWFFHLNHPLQWVRVAGVVVAIDDYTGRRIYTVDDGSGANIECVVPVPKNDTPDTKLFPPDIDIGHVLDVKGGLSVFRDQKQIVAGKIVILKTTDEEVDFWTKIQQFRKDVLSKPWILDERTVRRLRQDAEGIKPKDDRRDKKDKNRIKRDDGIARKDRHGLLTTHEEKPVRAQLKTQQRRPSPPAPKRPARATGLEKRVKKRQQPHSHREIKYDALGI